MIKLTNATKEFAGDSLILNPDFIVSIFSDNSDPKNTVTNVFGIIGSNTQVWQVKETVDEIYKLFAMTKFMGVQ
jgi:hypothetical protein